MRAVNLGLFGSSSTLFLFSALVAVWAAGNGIGAWLRFLLFAAGIGGIGVMQIVANGEALRNHSQSFWRRLVGLASAFVGAIVAVAYMAFAAVTSDVAAGALIILIPLGATTLAWFGQRKYRMSNWLTLLFLVIAILGLARTSERSAWLGLAVGCTLALLCHQYWRRIKDIDNCTAEPKVLRRFSNSTLLIGGLILLGSALLLLTTSVSRQLISNLLGDSPYSRLYIWRDVLPFIQDYRFTGSGLGQTGMVLSTYVYLFHLPFLFQAYNLPLQIGIEQGIPGIIGFIGMMTAAMLSIADTYRRNQPGTRWFCTMTLAALIALTVHGMLDAALYVSMLMPLIFVSLGIAISLSAPSRHEQAQGTRPSIDRRRVVSALIPIAMSISLFLLPNSPAAWQANLGAVEQSRLELSVYAWPHWHIQDELRRSNVIDLSGAMAHFELALRLDPQNSTAHRRLGQIALSQGKYDIARDHLQVAYDLAPNHRVTRQLLGELYAVNGDVNHAVEVWQSGDTDPHKLELRQWWYGYLGASQEQYWLDEAVARYKHMAKHRT